MPNASDIPWKRISAESAAIVGSILLAFAIDAWWEDRNEIQLEQRLLASLQVEFEKNRELLREARAHYERRYDEAVRLLDYLEEDSAEIDKAEFADLVAGLLVNQTFHLESGAHDVLLASGELSLIRDQNLRRRLAAWPSFVAEWSEEQQDVFYRAKDVIFPYLSRSIPIRRIAGEFVPFPDGDSPLPVTIGSGEAASLDGLLDSVEFGNLVYQRAQNLWYAMRDGETLLAELAVTLESIQQNLEK